MQTVVGIFSSRNSAAAAVAGLRAIGLPEDSIVFLTPGNQPDLSAVPTTDAESDGIGKAITGFVGGAVGGGVGMGVGSALASLFVPGVGIVFAAGIAAGVLLGIGGAATGAKLGEETEKALDTGIPQDDVLFYRELLKQGRSLVVVSTDSDELAALARAVMHEHGSEAVETARRGREASRERAA